MDHSLPKWTTLSLTEVILVSDTAPKTVLQADSDSPTGPHLTNNPQLPCHATTPLFVLAGVSQPTHIPSSALSHALSRNGHSISTPPPMQGSLVRGHAGLVKTISHYRPARRRRATATCARSASQVDPSFRALSGRCKFTVRRHKFKKYSFSQAPGTTTGEGASRLHPTREWR